MNNEDIERRKLLEYYLSISNNDTGRKAEKWIGLRSFGWSEQEIEDACRPKDISEEEVLQAVSEMSARELRKLRREYLQEKRTRRHNLTTPPAP